MLQTLQHLYFNQLQIFQILSKINNLLMLYNKKEKLPQKLIINFDNCIIYKYKLIHIHIYTNAYIHIYNRDFGYIFDKS